MVSGGEPASLLGFRAPLHSGDRGTAQTIRLMRQLVDRALTDPGFVRFAIDLVRTAAAFDAAGELAAIFSWVHQNVRYTMDPVSKEKLYPPQELLKIRAGDCDDISMLIGALALAVGYPARVVTVAADPGSPEEFTHVYTEVEAPPGSGRWMALDAARPNAYMGRQPESYFRKRAWSLTDETQQDIKGLSGYCSMDGLGDDGGDGFDWSGFTSQLLTETPQIIAASTGQSSSVRLPGGTSVMTGNPYSSFATPYTPGYAVPAGGYGGLQQASQGIFSAGLPWILAGLVLVAVFKR